MKKSPNIYSLWFWRQVRKEWNTKISMRGKTEHFIAVFLCLNSDAFKIAWLDQSNEILEMARRWHEKNKTINCQVKTVNDTVLFGANNDADHILARSEFVKAMCKKFSQKA